MSDFSIYGVVEGGTDRVNGGITTIKVAILEETDDEPVDGMRDPIFSQTIFLEVNSSHLKILKMLKATKEIKEVERWNAQAFGG